MNYRHAFHAGNPADCMKHALLVWLLDALARKPAPFFVLDTHAGAGRYDLLAGPAERTGEWREGIAHLLHEPSPPLQRFVDLVERLQKPSPAGGLGAQSAPRVGEGGPQAPASTTLTLPLSRQREREQELPEAGMLYPGSPLLIRALLRPGDRLACCEMHPDDHAALHRLFRRDKQVGVHLRNGWEAIRALLPPKESRGLVLIDPPYEAPGEFERVLAGLRDGAARFNHGVYAAWYPIKHRSPVTTFHESIRLSGLRDVVTAELWLRPPTDPQRLNGCGLLVRNPPFGFEAAAESMLQALLERLGGVGSQVLRLADE